MDKISPIPKMISPAPLPAATPNVAPGATPEPSASPKATDSKAPSFAQMLERNRAAKSAPTTATPASPAHPPAALPGAPNDLRHPAQGPITAARPNVAAAPADALLQCDEAEAAIPKAGIEASDPGTDADIATDRLATPADSSAATDAALTQWLVSLQLPPAPAAANPVADNAPQTSGTAAPENASPIEARTASRIDPKPDPTGAPNATPLGAADSSPLGRPREAARAGTQAADAAGGRGDKPARDAGPALAGTPTLTSGSTAELLVVSAARADHNPPGTAAIDAPQWLTAAAQAGLTAAASGAGSAASPTPINLPTAVNSPEFPQALGSQLSVLVQGGVEHAELHLNPADMGPVSVQISVDGGQARIDFGADVAATRQAIENALPELASALADAGLTLTGGGVSQHSRPRQNEVGAGLGGGTRRVDGETAEATAPATRRAMARGGVDLYA